MYAAVPVRNGKKRVLSGSRLYFLYRDGLGTLPEEWAAGNSHDSTPIILEQLNNPETLQQMIDELDGELRLSDDLKWPSYFQRKAPDILRALRDLQREPLVFTAAESVSTAQPSFITQDELDTVIRRGGIVDQGKFRIYAFFLQPHTAKEKADFLRKEYGTGGQGRTGFDEWHDSKGLSYSRDMNLVPYGKVLLTWPKVAGRIDELIADGAYMTEAELAHIPEYEKDVLTREVYHFYPRQPEDLPRPYPYGTDFYEGIKIVRPLLDQPERVEEILEQMQAILGNTPETDRNYEYMRKAFHDLSAYQNGTFSLFSPASPAEKEEPAATEPPGIPEGMGYELARVFLARLQNLDALRALQHRHALLFPRVKAPELLGGGHLRGDQQGVVHRVERELPLYVQDKSIAPHRLEQAVHVVRGKGMCLYRDDHGIGGSQGVDDRQAQGGAAVNQHVVITVPDQFKIIPQDAPAVNLDGGHEGRFDSGQVRVGGDEVYPLLMAQDHAARVEVRFGEHVVHRRGQGEREFLRVGNAEAFRQVALRVSVHQQHLLALPGQADAKVDGRRGFPYAAFFVADRHDFAFLYVLKSLLPFVFLRVGLHRVEKPNHEADENVQKAGQFLGERIDAFQGKHERFLLLQILLGMGLHRVDDAERVGRQLDAQADKHVQVGGDFLCESQDAFQIKHYGSTPFIKIAARVTMNGAACNGYP